MARRRRRAWRWIAGVALLWVLLTGTTTGRWLLAVGQELLAATWVRELALVAVLGVLAGTASLRVARAIRRRVRRLARMGRRALCAYEDAHARRVVRRRKRRERAFDATLRDIRRLPETGGWR